MNETTPITEVVTALKLPEAVLALVGVRTFGDLLVVLDRGDLPKEIAAQIKKALPK